MPTPDSTNTCAVVVTYHPDRQLAGRLSRFAPQVDRIILVDNASGCCFRELLGDQFHSDKIQLIGNDHNEGIAAALNRGLRQAARQNYAWALTMDQDSVVDADLIRYQAEIYNACPYRDQIGVIGSNYQLGHTGIGLVRSKSTQRPWFEDATAITSGSLISIASLKFTGMFREDFFIDSVDHEFCLRQRQHGFRIVVARRELMIQPIGKPKVFHLVLGTKIVSLDHPPIRRYYQARNRLVLLANYYDREPRFCLRVAMGIASDIAVVILCEKRKIAKLHAMLLGFIHAGLGHMGRLSHERWQ